MQIKSTVFVLSALVILLSGFVIYEKINQPKTGYIIIGEVFNEFQLKKDLEKKFKTTAQTRKLILDSLEFQLNVLSKKIQDEQGKDRKNIDVFQIKRDDFLRKKKQFEEENIALTNEYDQQIIKQLNQYTKDYGKEHGYTYIFGTDGNGSLMYGSENKNINKEIVTFINKKYLGN